MMGSSIFLLTSSYLLNMKIWWKTYFCKIKLDNQSESRLNCPKWIQTLKTLLIVNLPVFAQSMAQTSITYSCKCIWHLLDKKHVIHHIALKQHRWSYRISLCKLHFQQIEPIHFTPPKWIQFRLNDDLRNCKIHTTTTYIPTNATIFTSQLTEGKKRLFQQISYVITQNFWLFSSIWWHSRKFHNNLQTFPPFIFTFVQKIPIMFFGTF